MKITLKLTPAEVIESEVAFGVTPMLSQLLAKTVGDATYRFPLMNVIPPAYGRKWYHWFMPKSYQLFRMKSCYTEGRLMWALGLFNIKGDEIIHEAIDNLFGFDNGDIARGLNVDRLVMKNGEIITDFQRIQIICESDGAVNEIEYGESEIEIGNFC